MHTSVDTALVALVGAPNSGKTTLYNQLTGSNYMTVNYPGSTVEVSFGDIATQWLPSLSHSQLRVIDTPGTYSLFPKGGDEEITFKTLFKSHSWGKVQTVVVTIDGTQLPRQLPLAQQLKSAGFYVIIAITMQDLLQKDHQQIKTSILEHELNIPVILINGLTGDGIPSLVQQIERFQKSSFSFEKLKNPTKLSMEETEHQQKYYQILTSKTIQNSQHNKRIHHDFSLRLDHFFLHPILGAIFFLLIMTMMFASIFWLSTPFMDFIEHVLAQLGNQLATQITHPLWADFISNGLFSSFAAVLVFTPQIFILSLGIGLLESSGYLARAATIVDKPFSLLGLSGRSFVPLLSGYACAVPAIMATRNISSKKEQFITSLIIPMLTCSARLPVYALLIQFLFYRENPWKSGFMMALIYIGSMILSAAAAGIINQFIKKSETSFFMMDLPRYRKPLLKMIFRLSFQKTLSYIKRAGPIIFIFSVIIWYGTQFPNYSATSSTQKLEESYLGSIGKSIEPIVKPMGIDWRVGMGLLTAFAARETFVSTLAVIFDVTDADSDTQTPLIEKMKEAKNSEGLPIFTMASVLSLIVFFMIAMQCFTTSTILAKEVGGWKTSIYHVLALNIIAYVLSVFTYFVFS